jgi:uracil-DNA glycosylase
MDQPLTLNPFKFTNGPRDASILIVGEAWGAEEAFKQEPFVGQAGQELDRMLFEAGLRRNQVLCTNVMDTRPNLQNDFAAGFTLGSKEPGGVPFRGLNCHPTLIDGIKKLERLIDTTRPELIIGCGNWPLWALTEADCVSDKSIKSKVDQKSRKVPVGITKWRGSQTFTREINGLRYPFLPIIHPAAILRDWTMRHATVHDLRARAQRFISNETTWATPQLNAIPNPTFEEARDYLTSLLSRLQAGAETWIACDIETPRGTDRFGIKHLICIGLATDDQGAICLPFYFFERGTYVEKWNLDQEVHITQLLRQILTHKNALITNQNIIFDASVIFRNLGIRIRPAFDTMVGHHLCWPGTPKDLNTLSSLYCNHHCYWKDESDDWDIGSEGPNKFFTYNCKDTLSTLEITHEVRKSIRTLKLDEQLACRLDEWELAFAIMRRGCNYDRLLRDKFNQQLYELSNITSEWLLKAMPPDLRRTNAGGAWYSSPIFQQEIFYDKLGLAPILNKKTKRPTLNKEAFESIRKKTPWLSPLLDRLELQRSIGVFKENFLAVKLSPNGRFTCEFKISGTETFRWSSSSNCFGEGGNFQNIPKIEEE